MASATCLTSQGAPDRHGKQWLRLMIENVKEHLATYDLLRKTREPVGRIKAVSLAGRHQRRGRVGRQHRLLHLPVRVRSHRHVRLLRQGVASCGLRTRSTSTKTSEISMKFDPWWGNRVARTPCLGGESEERTGLHVDEEGRALHQGGLGQQGLGTSVIGLCARTNLLLRASAPVKRSISNQTSSMWPSRRSRAKRSRVVVEMDVVARRRMFMAAFQVDTKAPGQKQGAGGCTAVRVAVSGEACPQAPTQHVGDNALCRRVPILWGESMKDACAASGGPGFDGPSPRPSRCRAAVLIGGFACPVATSRRPMIHRTTAYRRSGVRTAAPLAMYCSPA